MDYFERVARVMKATHSAGSLNSYEAILTALHQHFKTEAELRAHIAEMEVTARKLGAPADWRFVDERH